MLLIGYRKIPSPTSYRHHTHSCHASAMCCLFISCLFISVFVSLLTTAVSNILAIDVRLHTFKLFLVSHLRYLSTPPSSRLLVVRVWIVCFICNVPVVDHLSTNHRTCANICVYVCCTDSSLASDPPVRRVACVSLHQMADA